MASSSPDGTVKRMVVPVLSVFSTAIVPPMDSMMSRQIVSPSPLPPSVP